jgi:hypothetical protein
MVKQRIPVEKMNHSQYYKVQGKLGKISVTH